MPQGSRAQASSKTQGVTLYHVRQGTTVISLRAIEVAVVRARFAGPGRWGPGRLTRGRAQSPKSLVSRDCMLVRDATQHVITLWRGRGATKVDEDNARSLASMLPLGQEVGLRSGGEA